MKTIIEEQIKEHYGKKETFCEQENYPYKDFSRLIKKFERWVAEMNKMLDLIGLEIQITPKPKNRGAEKTVQEKPSLQKIPIKLKRR